MTRLRDALAGASVLALLVMGVGLTAPAPRDLDGAALAKAESGKLGSGNPVNGGPNKPDVDKKEEGKDGSGKGDPGKGDPDKGDPDKGNLMPVSVECGEAITADTALAADVGPCPGDGITIGVDGITLNLNGHRVFADNGDGDNAGVRVTGVSGVTVTNGTAEGFDAGVVIEGGSANTVRDVGAVNNINDALAGPCDLGDGIAVQDSDGNTIEGNFVNHNGPYGGITLIGDSDDNVVNDNQVRNNNVGGSGGGCGNPAQNEGIRVEGPGANGNRIEFNQVSGSLLSGIGLHGHVCNPPPGAPFPPEPGNTGNVVKDNDVSQTSGTDIASGINFLQQGPATIVCPAFDNIIERNRTTANQSDGIFVAANSHDNRIIDNRANENGNDGIHLNGPRFATNFENVGPTVVDVVTPDLAPFTEGTDYEVMFGSGSGDVTANLVAIDLAIPSDDPVNPNPVDTSTSGCEASDFTDAGFEVGDVALIQRGTCTFVAKVDNAIAAGASAVIMFNEGQTGRTAAGFGSVGGVDIPVISASYALGQQLNNLLAEGEVTINVVTNTTSETVEAAPGAFDNIISKNTALGNEVFDAFDGTFEPPCDNNLWEDNKFDVINQPCVGSGEVPVAPDAVSSEAVGASADQEGGIGLTDRGQDDRPSTSAVAVAEAGEAA